MSNYTLMIHISMSHRVSHEGRLDWYSIAKWVHHFPPELGTVSDGTVYQEPVVLQHSAVASLLPPICLAKRTYLIADAGEVGK